MTDQIKEVWAWTTDGGDRWHEAGTRDAAIEAMKADGAFPKSGGIVAQATTGDGVLDFFMGGLNPEDILSAAGDWAQDNAWEDAHEAYNTGTSDRIALGAVIREWAATHLEMPPWIVEPDCEREAFAPEPIATESPTPAGAE